MVGNLVPVEDGLELWWFRHIDDSCVVCALVGSHTLHAVYFDLSFTSLRVDLLVVEFRQLVICRRLTFRVYHVDRRERGTVLVITNESTIVLLLSQLLLQPGLFGLLQYLELPCDQVNLLTAHVPSRIELFIFGIRLRRLIYCDLFITTQHR